MVRLGEAFLLTPSWISRADAQGRLDDGGDENGNAQTNHRVIDGPRARRRVVRRMIIRSK